MEAFVELLKKVDSDHMAQITDLHQSVATTDSIKQLQSRWMHKQGLDWNDNDVEYIVKMDYGKTPTKQRQPVLDLAQGRGSNGGSGDSQWWTKRMELPAFEGVYRVGWIAKALKF